MVLEGDNKFVVSLASNKLSLSLYDSKINEWIRIKRKGTKQ